VSDSKEDIKARRAAAIRRIVGLMSKTTEAGCTEEEAMAAANLASSLMSTYELSLTDLQLKEQANCQEGGVNSGFKALDQHSFKVLSAIAYLTDTKTWTSLRGNHRHAMFFGFETDVIIAKYIYAIVDRAMNFSTVRYKHFYEGFNQLPRHQQQELSDAFQNGMAYRLSERLRAMKEARKDEAASNGRSLVIVKDALVNAEWHKLGLKLNKPRRERPKSMDAAAWNAGAKAADRVQFNDGIGAAPAAKKIA
jgi:hypothetical protein